MQSITTVMLTILLDIAYQADLPYQLFFRVQLAALGYATYFISVSNSPAPLGKSFIPNGEASFIDNPVSTAYYFFTIVDLQIVFQ